MRIALHLGTLRGMGTGGKGRHLLRELAHTPDRHEYVAWVPKAWSNTPDHGLERRYVRPGIVSKTICENITIRRELTRWRADRLFSFGDTSLPACPVPHLLIMSQPHLAYEPSDWGFSPSPQLRFRMWLVDRYFRLGLPSATRLAVPTFDIKERVSARYGISSDRIAVVPNAVDPIWYAQAGADGTERRKNPEAPMLLYLASAYEHKNHTVLAGMMRRLRTQFPKARCLLTVDAASVPSLVAEAKRDGVLQMFDFLGAVAAPECARLGKQADVMVIPSALESFGLTYYEAMAAGCPIVAADRPFAREACGDAALYAAVSASEAFAAQVARVITCSSTAAELIARGRKRLAEAALTWSDVADRYLSLLESM